MRKKWIKLFPLLIGAVIAYCLLWYVIPQNKGGGVAALLVAAILLFFLILLRFVIGKNKVSWRKQKNYRLCIRYSAV